MAALDAIPDEIKEAAQQNQPVIHLNLRSASSVITNCIIAYREIHPEVKFRLSQKPDDPVADYFISATGLDTELKPSQRVLFTEEFYLAVPTSSELSHKHSIRLQDTATESYVSLEKTRPVRQICDEFCAAAEFKPNIVYESDSIWRICHKTRSIFYLWKGDDVTDAVLLRHKHDQTIQTICKTCMWRNTILECIDEEAKLFVRFFFGKAKCLKHRFLYIVLMNTDGTTTKLSTVQHDIVCSGAYFLRICL